MVTPIYSWPLLRLKTWRLYSNSFSLGKSRGLEALCCLVDLTALWSCSVVAFFNLPLLTGCYRFDALGYQEHSDYELIRSTNPEHVNVIVRVNIFRSHRQVIQYIAPDDHKKLGQAELVVIDEAAAIPLPYVKALLGPYLVFISSTVNGYEGTGRSLSLKLIKELKEQAGVRDKNSSVGGKPIPGYLVTFRSYLQRISP